MSASLCQDAVQQFVDLSRDFSIRVNEALMAVKCLNEVCHEIESAVSKIRDVNEVDNVVRQRLMHEIARRDMGLLLGKNIFMGKLLAKSIELLIQSGEAALNLSCCSGNVGGLKAIEVYLAKAKLVESLSVLKGVELNMLIAPRLRL